jgi:hypothetical protein
MDPHLCVGVDVGCRSHRVGIALPDGSILEEFDISHSDAGFQEFFRARGQMLYWMSSLLLIWLSEWLAGLIDGMGD